MKTISVLAILFSSSLWAATPLLSGRTQCELSDYYINFSFDKSGTGEADFWVMVALGRRRFPLPKHLFGPIPIQWQTEGTHFVISGNNFRFLMKANPSADYSGFIKEISPEISREKIPSSFAFGCFNRGGQDE